MRRLSPVLFVLAGLASVACRREEGAKAAGNAEAPSVRIAAIRVEPQSFTSTVPITGTLVCPVAVTVKAETTGRVLRVSKEEGDAVTAGEPVVWVDDSHEELALKQAESAVRIAEVALERARVMQAHAHAEWARAENLLKSGGITDRDYKAADLADRDANAQIASAGAQLEQARSQLAFSKKMREDSVVRSPIAGELQARITSEGAYVEPPTPVFSVVNNAKLELESMVAAAQLGGIAAGQRVKFSVNTYPGQTFSATVIEVSPAVHADTRSAKVRMRVDNSSRRLKAGMFAQGTIETEGRREGILVPASAVYRDARSLGSGRLYVIENGRAKAREIAIGLERDSQLEVVKGLTAGEVIAAEMSIELADGVAVSPETGSR